ncbi:hypothetical protein [Metabacillus fastidiosus]|uniref:hypothetical protein n=1 Tax=Metabacillus fastidiosus TaxID=1458 RepID=UPI003D2DF300
MSSKLLFQSIGGWASVISGLLLASAHLINLLGGTDNGTVLGKSLVLCGHIGLIFAFIGLFEAQKTSDILGRLGMLSGVIGTVFVTAIVFVEIAGASGVNIDPVLNEGISSTIYMAGPLLFVLGMILFGISVIKENILPRMGGIGLIMGTLVFAMAAFIPDIQGIITVIGAIITGAGFVWLGIYLLYYIGKRESTK